MRRQYGIDLGRPTRSSPRPWEGGPGRYPQTPRAPGRTPSVVAFTEAASGSSETRSPSRAGDPQPRSDDLYRPSDSSAARGRGRESRKIVSTRWSPPQRRRCARGARQAVLAGRRSTAMILRKLADRRAKTSASGSRGGHHRPAHTSTTPAPRRPRTRPDRGSASCALNAPTAAPALAYGLLDKKGQETLLSSTSVAAPSTCRSRRRGRSVDGGSTSGDG